MRNLESGCDVEVLFHVSPEHLTDAALANLLVIKRGVCLYLQTQQLLEVVVWGVYTSMHTHHHDPQIAKQGKLSAMYRIRQLLCHQA